VKIRNSPSLKINQPGMNAIGAKVELSKATVAISNRFGTMAIKSKDLC